MQSSLPPLRSWPAATFGTGVVALVLGAGLWFDHPAGPGRTAATQPAATSPVAQLAQWAVSSGDSRGLPFLVIDKSRAELFVFDTHGRLRGSSPVLLSAVVADGPLLAATPAGRFEAQPGTASAGGLAWHGAQGELLVRWPGSDLAPGKAALRLASDRAQDKRISDGSLYVQPAFFDAHLRPLRQAASVAYVLPEQQPVKDIFGPAAALQVASPLPLPRDTRRPL